MPFLKTTEGSLCYELCGHGWPVLFIHGVGVPGSAWEPQISGLREFCQILTFDHRGLGRSIPSRGEITIASMVADTHRLMDEVGWESAHVVGHSMGGIIAQELALAHPGRVRSLALICTCAWGGDVARIAPWTLWMTLRTRIGPLSARRRAFLRLLFTNDYLREQGSEALALHMSGLLGRDLAEQPPVLMRQLRALRKHRIPTRLGELRALPVLVMNASSDPIMPARLGRKLVASIPGALYDEIPQASHGVMIEKAARINERLLEFLKAGSCDAGPTTERSLGVA